MKKKFILLKQPINKKNKIYSLLHKLIGIDIVYIEKTMIKAKTRKLLDNWLIENKEARTLTASSVETELVILKERLYNELCDIVN